MTNREIGRLCENEAENYVKNCGMEIIDRNYRCREGEIDIIAKENEYTVFVEVKARKSNIFGEPCEAVNITKRRRLTFAAQMYMAQYGECAARFDIAEVFYAIDKENVTVRTINYIRNAFEAEY